MVDNHRGQNRLARPRLSRDGKRLEMALQELSEVMAHPETGQFLALMGEVGGGLRNIGENVVVGRKPRSVE